MEKEKKKEKEEEEKISHMCESIGHRPLRGRCPKGSEKFALRTKMLTMNKLDTQHSIMHENKKR